MGEFFSFYGSVFREAFSHAIELAETAVFVLLIALGAASFFFPRLSFRGHQLIPEREHAWRTGALILAAIVGIRLVLGPYWVWKDEHLERLKLEQQLKNPITVSFEWANGRPFLEPATGQLWIRVRAINNSAHDTVCRVFLNELDKGGANKPLWSGETLRLNWAGTENEFPGNDERTVEPGPLGKIFNLVYIARDANELTVQNPQFANQVSEKLSPGIYSFTVQANYSTCRSEPVAISVKYDGKQIASFMKTQISGR